MILLLYSTTIYTILRYLILYITILYLLLLYTAILLNLFKCVIIIYITIYVIFVTAILRYLILYITIFLLLLYYWYCYSKVLSITATKNQHNDVSTLWYYYYILELWYYYYLLKTMTKKQWLPELCPELVELNAAVRMRFAKFREVHQLQICYCAILNYYLW